MHGISRSMNGLLPALAAPALFGAGAALTKAQLAGVHPVLMAGLLYLSAGIGLGLWRLVRPSREAGVARTDLPRLAGVAACGGLAAPALLMAGLASMPASHASLLLNLEAPLTALLAWALFKEHVGRRAALGIALVTIGAAALSGLEGGARVASRAHAAVLGACFFWALDNNLTQKLSEKDPLQVAAFKGTAAGAFNVAAGLSLGAELPQGAALAWIALIGLLSYGVSLTFYLSAVRRLGAARTALYFSLAPFFGAAVAVGLLREPLTAGLGAAALLMGAGVWLTSTERHEHDHVHGEMHEHLHIHDEHHGHEHRDESHSAHSHAHSHVGLSHSHPHDPDIHHRH
jgi:drug/metabolite transporter (DMT)-like permease